jgi:hypothetical protein
MMKPNNNVDRLQTVSPCSTDWEQMIGDERRRFCADCGKHVYNLAEMKRTEVEALIAATGGRFCARLVRLPDGRVQTSDDEVVSRPLRLRASRVASVLVSALLSVSATATPKPPSRPAHSSTSVQQASDHHYRSPQTAAAGRAALVGTVYDPQRAVIQNATVRLINESSHLDQVVTTSEEGEFEFRKIEPGSYSLKVESLGFVTFSKPNIELRAGQLVGLDVTLQVGTMGGMALIQEKGGLDRIADAFSRPLRKIKQVFTINGD